MFTRLMEGQCHREPTETQVGPGVGEENRVCCCDNLMPQATLVSGFSLLHEQIIHRLFQVL